MAKLSILLVDDHKLVRDSWSFILNNDPRFEVVGQAENADEAVLVAKETRPDIILMDINMTPVNGFEATKLVLESSPSSKVIGVSMHSLPAYAKRMLKYGASGYVTKNSSKEELIEAIVEVSSGRKYICAEVKSILSQQELENDSHPDINSLSSRELDIAKLIRDGLSSREIAKKLGISYKTVEVHRYHILKKLDLKNTAALVNFINVHSI